MHVVNVATQNSRKKYLHRRSKKASIRYFFYFALVAFIFVSFIASPLLYAFYIINKANMLAISSIALSLAFPFMAFSYLLAKGHTLKEAEKELGLEKRKITIRYITIGIALFLLFFFGEIIASIISSAINITINTNVQAVTKGLPLYFFAFAIILAPIDEEILFRGLLCPRIGIIASALIFSILHYLSYFSMAELVAAFIFGVAAGYIFMKTSSLYPSIIGHMLFDLTNIIIMLMI